MGGASVLWALVCLGTWWVGATAAGVRREMRLLEQGRMPDKEYPVISLLRRLQDDPVSLALRFRLSRVFSAVFLPLSLAATGLGLTWQGTLLAVILGWSLSAIAEAVGGGVLARRLGRLRNGLAFSVWARLLGPLARATTPILGLRTNRLREGAESGWVLAESRAALLSSGGKLGREERRFLRRLLASTSILVTDIQTPWGRVQSLSAAATPREAARLIRSSGKSRLPVLEEEKVIGLITARDVLPHVHSPDAKTGSIGSHLRPVYFVRQEATMEALLGELQAARVHLAVVLDRLGRHVGIVTMEDVLEEIVGELHDEREREQR